MRAPTATPAAIAAALAQGHFYASSGPELRDVRVLGEEDGALRIHVETSPCAAIYLLAYGENDSAYNAGAIARGELGATITEATLSVSPPVAPTGGNGRAWYVRVQATDWQRRSAWSNPIFAS